MGYIPADAYPARYFQHAGHIGQIDPAYPTSSINTELCKTFISLQLLYFNFIDRYGTALLSRLNHTLYSPCTAFICGITVGGYAVQPAGTKQRTACLIQITVPDYTIRVFDPLPAGEHFFVSIKTEPGGFRLIAGGIGVSFTQEFVMLDAAGDALTNTLCSSAFADAECPRQRPPERSPRVHFLK